MIGEIYSQVIRLYSGRRAMKQWRRRRFSAPSPHRVKLAMLDRLSFRDAVWIETGTYRGDTTAALMKKAPMVFSIEPEPRLARLARLRFRDERNVRIVEGSSESQLTAVLATVDGDVNLWLDGHYSAGDTYMGPSETPIRFELETIAANRSRLGNLCVFIDDVRLFPSALEPESAYPPLNYLVEWASRNNLYWAIEHDIFVAKSVRIYE